MIQVAVHGAEGRMGQLITGLVEAAEDMELVGLVTEPGKGQAAGEFHPVLPLIGQEVMAEVLPANCVVIDFSLAVALEGLLEQGMKLGSPLVIGTTGYSEEQESLLLGYASGHAVVFAANYSVGIPALQMLLQLLAKTLPAGFDAEQTETHHITKLDRPSGTASSLRQEYQKVRGGDEVPTHSLRLGGVIGEHTWTFSDAEETLVLTHRAHSRHAFMRGILPSVRYVASRDSGMYGLTDVLKGLAAE